MRFGVKTRKALLPDSMAIHELIRGYASEGILLPRPLAEIHENIRDFTVVVSRGEIIGCGALHFYGPHLAEVRSIAVSPNAQKRGAGSKLIGALVKEAQQHQIAQLCLFTRSPKYFARLGFVEVAHQSLPDKMFKDCQYCPRFNNGCDEVAMVHGGESALEMPAVAASQSRPALTVLQSTSSPR